MIKSVTIVSDRDRAIRFDLQHPEKSGFAVIGIDGLGPTKSQINFSSDHALNTKHESSVPELRNITIKLQYYGLPDDIERNRRRLYTYFGVGRMIKVIIHTGERILQTNGYTESLEPDIFSGDQTYNISIMCDSPYFKNAEMANSDILIRSKVEEDMFEFPFSNPVGTKSLEFSKLAYKEGPSSKEIIIDNDGDIDIGFEIVFYPFKREKVDQIVLKVNSIYMRFPYDIISSISSLINNDPKTKLVVNTKDGFRKIVMLCYTGSKYENVDVTAFMYLTNQHNWPQLLPGKNRLNVYSVNQELNDDIESITGDPLYLGV